MSSLGPMLARFPRPRGDGPADPMNCAAVIWVSAHAGMVPSSNDGVVFWSRFPRPRGDGPVSIREIARRLRVSPPDGPEARKWPDWRTAVSPPTRGWSRLAVHEVRVQHGFPAHAGMVPKMNASVSEPNRFPRPRGDGPFPGGLPPALRVVSPPTRGWSRALDGAGAGDGGFPAHAGMVPRPA